MEVFSYELLKKVQKKATKFQREGDGVIISYLKDNPKSINSINIPCPIKKLPTYRLTVDEEVDLKLVRKIYENFTPNIYFGFNEIVAFAKKINRVGYCKGYYDRYLSKLVKVNKKIEVIGIAFSFQKYKKIPTDKYDIRLNKIYTEKGFLK